MTPWQPISWAKSSTITHIRRDLSAWHAVAVQMLHPAGVQENNLPDSMDIGKPINRLINNN